MKMARNWWRIGQGSLLATALLAAPHSTQSAVPASGIERLQQLARLPQLSFSLGLSFTATGGFELLAGAQDPARALEALRQQLAANPGDASLYVRLGRLLATLNENELSRRAYAQAVELYAQQGAADGRDPARLVGYAEALRDQGKPDEAGRLLRRAVEVAPTNGLAHGALARFLAWSALKTAAGPAGSAELFLNPARFRPEAALVELARRLMDEAQVAADRGVALDPREPAVFSSRAVVTSLRRVLGVLTAATDAADVDAAGKTIEINRAIFQREALPDLWTAARLAGDDPNAWGCAAMCELLAEAFQRGLQNADALLTGEFWPLMPETTRQRVREAITRLGTIGDSAEPVAAASALTLLGTLQFFVLRDTTGGEASLRRATAVDPGFPGGWEALTFGLVFSKRFEALIEVCQARLRHADNLRNRVLLAKALEKHHQPATMLAELERAQQRNPDALLANLALGAAWLKTGADQTDRARALPFLAKATQLAGEAPPREIALEVAFQRGLYFALSGQRSVARTHFGQILELDPGNPEATEALQALAQLGD